MSEFVPFLKAHAIERCAVSLAFHPDMPEKLFDNLIKNISERLNSLDFNTVRPVLGIQVDSETGNFSEITGGAPVNYQSKNGRWNIHISTGSISFMTEGYTRWSNFIEAFDELIKPIYEKFNEVVSLGGIKLEYWDRFNWTGTWDDFEFKKLINLNGRLANAQPLEAKREWHSHIGWFEYLDKVRILHNINVDVSGIQNEAEKHDAKPSVGIYTMAFEQAAIDHLAEFDSYETLSNKLNILHDQLKSLMIEVLHVDTKRRIGL